MSPSVDSGSWHPVRRRTRPQHPPHPLRPRHQWPARCRSSGPGSPPAESYRRLAVHQQVHPPPSGHCSTQLRIRRPGDQSRRHLEGGIGLAQTVGRLLKAKVKIAVPNVPWEVCGTKRDGSRIRQTGFDNERRISMVELRLGCQERERPVGINDQKFLLEFDGRSSRDGGGRSAN